MFPHGMFPLLMHSCWISYSCSCLNEIDFKYSTTNFKLGLIIYILKETEMVGDLKTMKHKTLILDKILFILIWWSDPLIPDPLKSEDNFKFCSNFG